MINTHRIRWAVATAALFSFGSLAIADGDDDFVIEVDPAGPIQLYPGEPPIVTIGGDNNTADDLDVEVTCTFRAPCGFTGDVEFFNFTQEAPAHSSMGLWFRVPELPESMESHPGDWEFYFHAWNADNQQLLDWTVVEVEMME